MKRNKIGILTSILGIFVIGLNIGNTLKNDESNMALTIGGLFIVSLEYLL